MTILLLVAVLFALIVGEALRQHRADAKATTRIIEAAQIDRAEWLADRMLLDADEAFANSLGIYRPEPLTQPMLEQNRRLAEMMQNLSQDRAQQSGPLLQAMTNAQMAQQQAQMRGNPLGGLGGMGALGLGAIGGIFGRRDA